MFISIAKTNPPMCDGFYRVLLMLFCAVSNSAKHEHNSGTKFNIQLSKRAQNKRLIYS